MKRIVHIQKVYSRDIASDFFQTIRNLLGTRLKGYEKMIDKGMVEVTTEFMNTYPKAKDITYKITEFTNGAVMIMVVGIVTK